MAACERRATAGEGPREMKEMVSLKMKNMEIGSH